jgi:hypothetical protein
MSTLIKHGIKIDRIHFPAYSDSAPSPRRNKRGKLSKTNRKQARLAGARTLGYSTDILVKAGNDGNMSRP